MPDKICGETRKNAVRFNLNSNSISTDFFLYGLLDAKMPIEIDVLQLPISLIIAKNQALKKIVECFNLLFDYEIMNLVSQLPEGDEKEEIIRRLSQFMND